MSAKGIVLASNVAVVADQPAQFWGGGRAAIILDASTYPTTCNLQCQGPGGSWININATTYSANQVTAYDLPAGNYRIHMASGTVAAFYASLVSVPY
jgi:hypothetical protein